MPLLLCSVWQQEIAVTQLSTQIQQRRNFTRNKMIRFPRLGIHDADALPCGIPDGRTELRPNVRITRVVWVVHAHCPHIVDDNCVAGHRDG